MKSNDLAIVREIAYLKHFEFKSCKVKASMVVKMGTDGKVRELVNIHVCVYTYGVGGRFKT